MTTNTKGYLLAAASAAAYGINPIARIMYNEGMTVDSVLCYRYLLAAFLLGLMMIWRHESFRISIRETFLLIALGMLFSLSSLCLFMSYQYIDVSIASTLLFCYPAMVALILWIFYHERPTMITALAIFLVAIGVVLLNSGTDGGTGSLFGVLVVILSSLEYAVYIVAIQKSSVCSMSSLKIAFYSIFFGSFIYIVRLNCFSDLQLPSSATTVSCALALAVFPTIVSITAMAKAIRFIGSTPTAIMGALEPVTAVLLGIIVFAERPTAVVVLGMIIVLVAVTLIIKK